MNLSAHTKLTLVKVGLATGTTAVNSDAIDMEGFEGVMFFGTLTTANAGNSANIAQATTSGGTYADLAGTKIVPGDNGDSFMIDVYRPRERFVRCELDRSGATPITGDIYALQYGAAVKPTSHGATIDAELHVSPAEGTA